MNKTMTRLAMLALVSLCAAPAARAAWKFWEPKGRPDWIDDVAAREKAFPPARHLVGVGAADADSRLEGDKRRKAEDVAGVRIRQTLASGLEEPLLPETVEILMRACRTQRVYFDEEGGKWYVLTALEVREAARGAVEAARQCMADARARGARGTGSDMGDYLRAAMQKADGAALDDLLKANRLLGGATGEFTIESIATFKAEREAEASALASNVAVRITAEDLDGRSVSPDVVNGFQRVLAGHGVPTVTADGRQSLIVTLTTESDTSMKGLGVHKFRTGGGYVLREGTRDLISHRLAPGAETEATSSSESISRQRSLLLFLNILAEHLDEALATLGGKP